MKRPHIAVVIALGVILAAGGTWWWLGHRTVNYAGRTWHDQVIYMIMTDRFADGDPGNDQGTNRLNPHAFHGGDLQGIIDHLDYLQQLGVTAIWITPVYLNPPGGYHGYWPTDFYKVDPHFGDLGTLKELVRQAHARGVRVLLDMVLNHTAPSHPWRSDPTKYDWYHHLGTITDYGDPVQVVNGDLAGLPDLNQDNSQTFDYLLRMGEWWIDQTHADGFRLDAARHISRTFWQKYATIIHKRYPGFFLIGEVWVDSPFAIAPYQEDGLDGAMDFPLYNAITAGFAQGQGRGPLVGALRLRSAYPDVQNMGVFIDNHDVPRFVTQAENAGGDAHARLRAALAFALTVPGVPIIYYGTEVALPGGPDPDNRRDMVFGQDPALTQYVHDLIALRRANPALWGKELDVLPSDGQTLAYLRVADSQSSGAAGVSGAGPSPAGPSQAPPGLAVVVFNLSDRAASVSVDLTNTKAAGTVAFRDALGGGDYTAQGSTLSLNLPAWGAAVLLPH